MLPTWAISAIRTAVQAGWGLVAAYAAAKLGLHLPDNAPDWATGAALAGATLIVTAGIRWLETRTSTSRWGRLARAVARWVMLRIQVQPTGYAALRPRAQTRGSTILR